MKSHLGAESLERAPITSLKRVAKGLAEAAEPAGRLKQTNVTYMSLTFGCAKK